MNRKILIATPIRLGLDSTYMGGFVDTMRTKFPGVELEFALLQGPAVNLARNELAEYAIKIGARELVFIDNDIKWTVDHFKRLISHVDLDIVGGIYCKKKPGRPYWLMNAKPEGIGEGEICEVEDIATGFMKIRVDTVFKAIREKFPELEFFCHPDQPGKNTSFEYFPMGVVGPRSAQARLERVKAAILSGKRDVEVINEVRAACFDQQEPGMLRGEDYYFTWLARQCGFKVYADFGMAVLPHVGDAAYPITPDMVGVSEDLAAQK